MQFVRIAGEDSCTALRVRSLPTDPAGLAEIVSVLAGSTRLSEFTAKTAARAIPGAERYLILVFDEAPPGGFGQGGIYGVLNWVHDSLNPAMPAGFGAACSVPGMLAFIANDDRSEFQTQTDLGTFLAAQATGAPIAYGVYLSPMDRRKTQVVGAYLNDGPGELLILIHA